MSTHEQNLLDAVLQTNMGLPYAIYSGGFQRAREEDHQDGEDRNNWRRAHPAFDPMQEVGVAPIAQGTRGDVFGPDGAMVWAVYRVSDLDASDPEQDAVDRAGWYPWERGVGRAFGADPSVRRVRGHILVKQYRGLDI